MDHLPQIIARMADAVEAVHSGQRASLADLPRAHALDRLARGFDLNQVVEEYALLRQCIFDLWANEFGSTIAVDEAARLDLAIDVAIEEAAVRFANARERTLKALDRISEAALGSSDLDTFLGELLRATLVSTESVDTAAVMLRDDGVLRVRAAVGLEEEVRNGFTVRVGEGFSGTVAATGAPLFLRHASSDALVKSPTIRALGVRALYGVPLVHGDRVIGVAHIGSLKAFEFSAEDQLLFRTMVSRATGVVVQAQLVEETRRTHEEFQRSAQALAKSEERLRLATEANNVGTWDWVPDTGEITWSDEAKRIFGIPATVEPYLGWTSEQAHPDDRDAIEGEIQRSLDPTGSGRFELEFRVRRASDGAVRWVAARGQTTFHGDGRPARMLGTFLDVTERKRADDALRFLSDATAILATSLEYDNSLERIAKRAVPKFADWCAVTLVAIDGRLEQVAVAHDEPEKVRLAQELATRYPPDRNALVGVAGVIRSRKSELRTEISDELLAQLTRGGEHFRVARELGLKSYMIVPMIGRERVLGAITFVAAESGRQYGVRDLEIAEHLARRSALAIENALLYEQAREATRLREELLAIVSHDLRGPLGTTQMAAYMAAAKVANTPAEPSVRRYHETILRSVGRMQHLVGDLLDVASIQAGRLTVELDEHQVGGLVDEVVDGYAPLAAEKGVKLRAAIDAARSVNLFTDKARLVQAFGNLVGNAIKFCRPGETVTVSAEAATDHVTFSVADTGPGIEATDLTHVFEAYFSGAGHSAKGTGLGLYITHAIIGALRGSIRVESQTGVGTRFLVTIPRATTLEEGSRR